MIELKTLCSSSNTSQWSTPQNFKQKMWSLDLKKKKKQNKTENNSVFALNHVWLFATPWTIVWQAPLSMEFSRQEYWSGLSFPPPGDLPNLGMEPESLGSSALAGGVFITAPLGIILFIKNLNANQHNLVNNAF